MQSHTQFSLFHFVNYVRWELWNAIRCNSKYPIKYLLATAMAWASCFRLTICSKCNGGNVLLFYLTSVFCRAITIRDILPGTLEQTKHKQKCHIQLLPSHMSHWSYEFHNVEFCLVNFSRKWNGSNLHGIFDEQNMLPSSKKHKHNSMNLSSTIHFI